VRPTLKKPSVNLGFFNGYSFLLILSAIELARKIVANKIIKVITKSSKVLEVIGLKNNSFINTTTNTAIPEIILLVVLDK